MNQIRLSPSVRNMSRFLIKPRFYSQSPLNPGTWKDQKIIIQMCSYGPLFVSSNKSQGSSASGNTKIYQEILVDRLNQKKRFSLIQPRSSNSLCNGRGIETKNNIEISFEILGFGMILLKNYICLNDQVEIVNICEKLNSYPNRFMELTRDNGEELGLHMMLLGLIWKVVSYDDSSLKQLIVPHKIISLVNSSIQDSQSHLKPQDRISSVCSYHCAVKFYTNTGQLTLHQDRDDDDSWYPYGIKGWPVVSMFIGDSAEFFYNDSCHMNKTKKVLLESGDVLIFGNSSRNIFHGLHKIIPSSAPMTLLKKTMLKPGLLNLSFREF